MHARVRILAPSGVAHPAFLHRGSFTNVHYGEVFVWRLGEDFRGRRGAVVGIFERSFHRAAGHFLDRILATGRLHIVIQNLVHAGLSGALRSAHAPSGHKSMRVQADFIASIIRQPEPGINEATLRIKTK